MRGESEYMLRVREQKHRRRKLPNRLQAKMLASNCRAILAATKWLGNKSTGAGVCVCVWVFGGLSLIHI